jgi:DNA polymerase-3 subunit alpha
MSTDITFENYNLAIHGVRLPQFNIDNRHKHKLEISEDCSNHEFLRSLCLRGFKNLNLTKDSPEYKKYTDRVKYELDILKELEFIDYVLLVWDVINFCKENDIPTGLGRGSAAGSLVLYLIGVTGVDPIKYDLYFERFVSKVRAKKQIVDGVTYLDGSLMCDVDLDICYYNRQKVIEYLEGKFKGKTSKVLTLNTLSGKLLMKECGKIIEEKSESEMNEVTALIPKVFGQVKDIEEAYLEEEKFKNWCDSNRTIYDIALKLRGLIKNKGVHPSAVSLSYEQINDSCPTELTSGKESFVSSYDMNWISLFNVKLDLLGLRSVSVVDDVCKQINIKITDINLNDPIIYQNLQELKTPHGLFQIEADTNFKVCNKVKPKSLDELSAVLALARPGALDYVDQYALFTNTSTTKSIHPFFDDILNKTGGVCLYQEQMMRMAHKIGFTLDEAEILRRIVGKKKIEEVKAWKEKISLKIRENKLETEIGDVLWKVLEDSANYSFNKCLSEDTIVKTIDGDKMLFEIKKGDKVLAYSVRDEKDHYVEVLDVHKNRKELYEVELEDGRKIKCSMDHKFLCEDKEMRPLRDIISQNHSIICSY